MIEAKEIKSGMPVTTAQAEQFAVVEAVVDADTIKLEGDASGQAHLIPVSWVISTQGGIVKINRTLAQVKEDWANA